MNFGVLLDVNTKVGVGAADAAAGAGAATATGGVPPTAAPTGLFGMIMANPLLMIIVYCVIIFAAMYFFSIKPQKKREAAMEDMRSKIKPGDSVLLNNGMFGRVVDTTADCFIIEFGTNKGVRIPVIKQEVAGVREPNLSNKAEEVAPVETEKKGLFGLGKKKEEEEKK